MTIPSGTSLSLSDTKTLHTLFDPESAPTATIVTIDPSLPADQHITDPELLSSLRKREVQAVQLVEKCTESAVETRHDVYLQALALLDALIEEHPEYASAYNNRAQLRRWRYGTRNPKSTSENQEAEEAALNDLATAITLATPAPQKSGQISVSPSQAKLLAQAWTQRAAIHWSRVKSGEISGEEKAKAEEEGSRAFYMAGIYGSEIGRAMSVLSNPTAKLCGGIVREALRREVEGVER